MHSLASSSSSDVPPLCSAGMLCDGAVILSESSRYCSNKVRTVIFLNLQSADLKRRGKSKRQVRTV